MFCLFAQEEVCSFASKYQEEQLHSQTEWQHSFSHTHIFYFLFLFDTDLLCVFDCICFLLFILKVTFVLYLSCCSFISFLLMFFRGQIKSQSSSSHRCLCRVTAGEAYHHINHQHVHFGSLSIVLN